jgi:hypothetical protein
MARGKKATSQKAILPRAREAVRSTGALSVKDYVTLNLIFGAFCIIQLVIVRILLRDFAGLYFFFGFIMCAFSVASVFDYLACKTGAGVPAEEHV